MVAVEVSSVPDTTVTNLCFVAKELPLAGEESIVRQSSLAGHSDAVTRRVDRRKLTGKKTTTCIYRAQTEVTVTLM